MQTTPLLQTLLNNFTTFLAEITAANNYRSEVKLTSRHLKGWQELSPEQFPSLFVLTPDGKVQNQTNKEITVAYAVPVIGYIKWNNYDTTTTPSAKLVDLQSDVIELLYKKWIDNEFGDSIEWVGTSEIETDKGEIAPFAAFRWEFMIHLSSSPRDMGTRIQT